MASKTPEGRVKDRIKEILKTFGAHYQMPVTGGFGTSGDPDFSVCSRGLFIGIEAKADRKRKGPTALQKKRMASIRDAGGLTFVIDVDNIEQLLSFFDWLVAGASKHTMRIAQAKHLNIWYEESYKHD